MVQHLWRRRSDIRARGGIAEQVRQNLEANYDKLRQLAEASANELTKSAEMYRTTDLATAKRLDSTYGEGQ